MLERTRFFTIDSFAVSRFPDFFRELPPPEDLVDLSEDGKHAVMKKKTSMVVLRRLYNAAE